MKQLLLTACAVCALTGLAAPAVAFDSGTTAPASVSAQVEDAPARLKALFDADWEYGLARSGSVKKPDGTYTPRTRLASVDPATQQARIDHVRATMAQLDTIPLDQLGEQLLSHDSALTNQALPGPAASHDSAPALAALLAVEPAADAGTAAPVRLAPPLTTGNP